MEIKISDSVKYIGANIYNLDLFEGQYPVPNGMAYNSYVILDEKIAIMDTADALVSDEWMSNLEKALDGKTPDYLVVQHLEPDHSANIINAVEKYPDIKIVCTAKAKQMLPQFADINEDSIIVKGEGDTLELGSHTLHFVTAPMVHWPEVMVSYESSEKILFSADAFGKFGAIGADEEWIDEARRYYFNIVGKYGKPVQVLLKKAAGLDIKTVCPLHGPVLTDTIKEVVELYSKWSSYEPEEDGVFIAFASIYGNTKRAAEILKSTLEEKGVKNVVMSDLSRADLSACVKDAFRFSKLVCMAPTYDGGVFPPMNDFINHLKSKAFQNRSVALVENGSWAPMAAKTMKAELEKMSNITFIGETITVKTTVKENDIKALGELADALV